jgi:hypothetical protein
LARPTGILHFSRAAVGGGLRDLPVAGVAEEFAIELDGPFALAP